MRTGSVGASPADLRRRSHAISAAVQVAAAQGVASSCSPRVVGDANNTVVHLAPVPLVAKVGTSVLGRLSGGGLEHELAVGVHLARARGPIAPPSSNPPPGRYRSRGLVVTLWRYREHDPTRGVAATAAASALRRLHGALAGYAGELPPFEAELREVGAVLADGAAVPALPRADRELLRLVHADLTAALAARDLDHRPLHGAPHEGNLLNTAAGPVWIDLESACQGPLEWDLAALPQAALAAFPEVDRELLALLRAVRSLCVAVKCWVQPERAPEVAEAAELHVTRLRERIRPSGEWARFYPGAARSGAGASP